MREKQARAGQEWHPAEAVGWPEHHVLCPRWAQGELSGWPRRLPGLEPWREAQPRVLQSQAKAPGRGPGRDSDRESQRTGHWEGSGRSRAGAAAGGGQRGLDCRRGSLSREAGPPGPRGRPPSPQKSAQARATHLGPPSPRAPALHTPHPPGPQPSLLLLCIEQSTCAPERDTAGPSHLHHRHSSSWTGNARGLGKPREGAPG